MDDLALKAGASSQRVLGSAARTLHCFVRGSGDEQDASAGRSAGACRVAKLNAQGERFAHVNSMSASVSRFFDHPRWEIHPGSDELLVGLSGELRLTLLLPEGPRASVLRAGAAIMVPRNIWRSPEPVGEVAILSLADYADTEVSDLEDPR
jgi:hypothetical protein